MNWWKITKYKIPKMSKKKNCDSICASVKLLGRIVSFSQKKSSLGSVGLRNTEVNLLDIFKLHFCKICTGSKFILDGLKFVLDLECDAFFWIIMKFSKMSWCHDYKSWMRDFFSGRKSHEIQRNVRMIIIPKVWLANSFVPF